MTKSARDNLAKTAKARQKHLKAQATWGMSDEAYWQWAKLERKMKKMRLALPALIAIWATLALTAPLAASEAQKTCGADQVQNLVGQPLADLGSTFPENTRLLPPNTPMTQDFRLDRMNVDLDANGVIIRIWCG